MTTLETPGDNSINFELITVGDAAKAAAKAETPAEHIARMEKLGEQFDLPKENPGENNSKAEQFATPNVNIESADDLREGMEIMVPVGSSVAKGRIDHLDISNNICTITCPVSNRDADGEEHLSRSIVDVGLKDLDTLKSLNNDPGLPWFRHEIGKEVTIPRSDGSVSQAKISFFYSDGSAHVEWIENGRAMNKRVSIGDIDSLNI